MTSRRAAETRSSRSSASQRWFGAKSQRGDRRRDRRPARCCASEPPARRRARRGPLRLGQPRRLPAAPRRHDERPARVDRLADGDDYEAVAIRVRARAGRLIAAARRSTAQRDVRVAAASDAEHEPAARATCASLGVEQSNSSIVVDDRADREGLPPRRGRREPRARAAALLRRARLRRTCRRCGAGGRTPARSSARRSGSCSSSSRAPSTAGASRSRSCASDPEAFLARARRLGEVIGEHARRARDASRDDPAFAPEEASPESLALLTATVDERDRRRCSCTCPDNEAIAPIVGRGDAVRDAAARALDRSARSAGASATTATSISARCSGPTATGS